MPAIAPASGGTAVVTPVAPADRGYLAWSFDPTEVQSASSLTAGVLFLQRIKVEASITVATLTTALNAAGVTLANCFIGAYRISDGVRLGVSADQASAWQSTGQKDVALTASFQTSDDFLTAILVGSGTSPTFARALASTPMGPLLNGPSAAGVTCFGTLSAGLTALPASITVASIARHTTALFVGAS